jgi:serine/threonine protein kinase
VASTSPPQADAAGFTSGYQISGYRLEKEIGRGGMAVVFGAYDERLERQVALKILAPSLAQDQAFRKRFIAESRAAAAVEDPHIIPVYEAGESNGVLFIAMRLVRGGDLRRLVAQRGPLAPARAEWIVSAVASALDAAHARGLVHRDVKPANMLLDVRPGRPDHVYLSDFGLSKASVSSVGQSDGGQFVGTVDYAAPEQILGRPVDGRTDQYALGCAAFELLCGCPPFSGGQVPATLYSQLSSKPPAATSERPDLPAAVDGVFTRVLAKSPADRYQSCQEFALALRAALGLKASVPEAPAAAGHGPSQAGDSGDSTLHPAAVHQLASGHTEPESVGADSRPTSQLAVGPPARARFWRTRRVVLGGAVAAILIAGGLTAVILGRAQPSTSVARYTFGGQPYPGGLEIRQQWTLGGPGGSSLLVSMTVSNTSSRPVTAQLEEPAIPAAITQDPSSVTFPSEVQPLFTSPLLVWDMGLQPGGHEVVSYQVPEPSSGISEQRLTAYVQAYVLVSSQEALLVMPPPGQVAHVWSSPQWIRLKAGQSRQLEAHLRLADGKLAPPADLAGAVWWSSRSAVLTVSRSGLVRAVGPGTARVWMQIGPRRASTIVVVTGRHSGSGASQPAVSGSQPTVQSSASPSPSPSSSPSSTSTSPGPTSDPSPTATPSAGTVVPGIQSQAAERDDRELTPA